MGEANTTARTCPAAGKFPDLILYCEYSPHIRVAYINQELTTLTRYDINEFYLDPELFFRIIHPDDRPILQTMFHESNSSLVEFRLVQKNGTILRIHGEFRGLFNPNGKLVFISGILRNVDMENKKLEKKERRSEIAKKLNHYVDELTFISNFGRDLGESGTPATVFANLAKAINRFYPDVYSVFISEVLPGENKIDCVYAKINGKVLNPGNRRIKEDLYSTLQMQNRAAEQKRPVIVNDVLLSGSSQSGEISPTTSADQIAKSAIFVPLITSKKVLGMIHLQSLAIDRFDEQDIYFLTALANIAAAVLHNTHLNRELVNTYDATVEGWGQAVDLRDHETEGHSVRVADLSRRLAIRLGLKGDQITSLWRGALLHDIGKLGIPDRILFKEGGLDSDEWVEMYQHPQYAYDMLKRIPFLKDSLEIPYCHHEKWDGSGYPRGLKGVQIPLGARIFAVADVWDALLSDRPYRHAWERSRAVEYIRNNLGTHFDPVIGEEFLRMVEEENVG